MIEVLKYIGAFAMIIFFGLLASFGANMGNEIFDHLKVHFQNRKKN